MQGDRRLLEEPVFISQHSALSHGASTSSVASCYYFVQVKEASSSFSHFRPVRVQHDEGTGIAKRRTATGTGCHEAIQVLAPESLVLHIPLARNAGVSYPCPQEAQFYCSVASIAAAAVQSKAGQGSYRFPNESTKGVLEDTVGTAETQQQNMYNHNAPVMY